jgi:lipopolysaccharide export system protein LptA
VTTVRRWAVLCILAAVPSLLAAQQARQPRNCYIIVDTTDRSYQYPGPNGSKLMFVGGIFRSHCQDQPTTMASDSLEWFSQAGELHLIGHAHFQDSTEVLDADRITYWTHQERVYSEGRVFARNVKDGSEMRGPNMDYYRAVPPIRDTLEMLANGRPTIRMHPAPTSANPDTTNPFVIVADRVKLRHTNRFWGSGRVTIDRRDMRARSDSAILDLSDSLTWLIGAARVVGRDTARPASDTTASYTLIGQRIRFDLNAKQEIRRVGSFRDADALGPDWHLVADTIVMYVDSSRIQRAQAWGKERRPVATSGLTTIVGDSLDIRMPGQVMQLVWAYRSARAVSRSDSAAPEPDWITGDSLRATFVRADSGGTARSDVDHVDSYGSARALYHTDNNQDPLGPRGINYSRGQRINIAMRDRKVKIVDIVGQVDGVYLEPRVVRPDSTARPDTSAVRPDTTALRPGPTRPDTSAARPRPR